MYEALLAINRDVARTFLGERGGRTVSEVIGTGIDCTFRLQPGRGKHVFHGALAFSGGALFGGLLVLAFTD